MQNVFFHILFINFNIFFIFHFILCKKRGALTQSATCTTCLWCTHAHMAAISISGEFIMRQARPECARNALHDFLHECDVSCEVCMAGKSRRSDVKTGRHSTLSTVYICCDRFGWHFSSLPSTMHFACLSHQRRRKHFHALSVARQSRKKRNPNFNLLHFC